MNIIFTKDMMSLIENGQITKMGFSAVSIEGDTIHTRHPFVKCRDYFNGIIIGSTRGFTYGTIYGFELDTKNFPINLDRTEILLEISQGVIDRLESWLHLLNKVEVESSFEPTIFHSIKKGREVYLLVTGDKRWISSSAYISLYTYLLRLFAQIFAPKKMCSLDEGIVFLSKEGKGNDAMYARSQEKQGVKISELLGNYEEIMNGCNMLGMKHEFDETEIPIKEVHSVGGFQNFLSVYKKIC